MIRFACPNCKKVLKAPPDKGGVKTSCPACKTPVVVPNPKSEPPAVATASVNPLPVAKPVPPLASAAMTNPPPVKAATPVAPLPARPPRSEAVVKECRTWAKFLSTMRDEDEDERLLDLGGPAVAEVRKRLDEYAAATPHHDATEFGTTARIKSLTEWCVYTVSVQAVFETRRLGGGEVVYSGWRLPAVPADPARLDVWDFRYRPPVGLTGRSENILHGTQAARACEPCGGRGDLTCATCGGGRTVMCPSCGGRGTAECGRCAGTRFARVRTGTKVVPVRCDLCHGGDLNYGTGPYRPCYKCNGTGMLAEQSDDFGDVPCPCGTGRVACSACRGSKQLRCPTCTGTGRSKCDRCRGGKQVVRYATLCRTFEPWARTATASRPGSDRPVVDALARLRAHQPLARLVTTDTPDPTALEASGVAGTARSLLEAIRAETTADRRPGCLALEVARATVVRVEYEYDRQRHVAWLLGRDRAVHAPTSPLTEALARTLNRAEKEWRQERRKEAVALVREAITMGERDVYCRAALDAKRAELPPGLWSAATNPGVLGAVAEGIGKLFGKWFG